MNLNQITIAVSNLDRSVNFYKQLGLTLIVYSPDNQYARFECPVGGATFSLHESEDFSSNGAAFYFEVEDVDARVKELKAEGIDFTSEPVDQRWLWREAWLCDPDGYRIAIYHGGDNRLYPPWRVKA
jgi:catechol 2,3-dioxygenase-like lactoylglutathione lyase family enzyme